MTDHLKIAFAQLNPTVGDIRRNMAEARTARAQAQALGADLLMLPELYVSGYPPEDLVLKPAFIDACRKAAENLSVETNDGGPAILLPLPWREGDKVYNAVALLDGGIIHAVSFKHDLPNYGVFDEKRVFEAGPAPGPINFRGVRIGVPICEDIWNSDVCETLQETGAEILLVPNGSPFERDKQDVRLNLVVARVSETGLPMVYLNQVGGQDELVFDGASFAINADHSLAFQMPAFSEELIVTSWQRGANGWTCAPATSVAQPDGLEEIWRACVLGLKDYVHKNHFPGVILGLSGGIDSAVVAAMAVDALGPDQVHCIMLPFHYTSPDSLEDAAACAQALAVRYDVVAIEQPVNGFMAALNDLFGDSESGVTEENIQSRTRGAILMAVSNKFGAMVLTTGNKSEMSVGYATLYGDMNGGYNPIKDVYKSDVFALAAWRNQSNAKNLLGPSGRVIPERIITKPPSAELRPDQTDQDSLPDYEVLDDILNGLVENETSLSELVARGHDKTVVERVQHLLYIAEYKRRQAAPGVKITRRAFGKERRYPITNGFRDKA